MGNYKMTGTLGTYKLKVSYQGYSSDEVYNLGLGGEVPGTAFDQTSFLFVFQLADAPQATTPAEKPSTEGAGESKSEDISPEASYNDAEHLGVATQPIVQRPFCRVKKIHHYAAAERMGGNTLYLDAVDEQGKRIYGAVILVKDAAGRTLRVPIEKPENEPGGNMPMWPDNIYKLVGVEVKGKKIFTQIVTGLRSLIPGHGDGHSFLVVVQMEGLS